jgi:hypothetical protein
MWRPFSKETYVSLDKSGSGISTSGTTIETKITLQQPNQLELGESFMRSVRQQQQLDSGCIHLDIHLIIPTTTTTAISNNTKSVVTTKSTRRTNRLPSSPSLLQSFYTLLRPCHCIIHAVASRSFYSVTSIAMILTNKSIDKRFVFFCGKGLEVILYLVVFSFFHLPLRINSATICVLSPCI